MVTYTVTVSDLEDKVLRHIVGSPSDWLHQAAKQKAARAAKRWIDRNTKYRASKLTAAETRQIVTNAFQHVHAINKR